MVFLLRNAQRNDENQLPKLTEIYASKLTSLSKMQTNQQDERIILYMYAEAYMVYHNIVESVKYLNHKDNLL